MNVFGRAILTESQKIFTEPPTLTLIQDCRYTTSFERKFSTYSILHLVVDRSNREIMQKRNQTKTKLAYPDE